MSLIDRCRSLHVLMAMALCAPGVAQVEFRPLVRTGQTVTGMHGGTKFEGIWGAKRNTSGAVVFNAIISGPQVNSTNDQGVWLVEPDGTITRIVREGDIAPGVIPVTTFAEQFIPQIDETGGVAWVGTLTGFPEANNEGIWQRKDGSSRIIAREGTQASGLGQDTYFGEFVTDFIQSEDGAIAFVSEITGVRAVPSDNTGVWLYSGGALSPIAIEGWPVPGLDGVSYDDFYFRPLRNAFIDSSGDLWVWANIRGQGVTPQSSVMLIRGNAGGVSIEARLGDELPGVDGLAQTGLGGIHAAGDEGPAMLASFDTPVNPAGIGYGSVVQRGDEDWSILYRANEPLPGIAPDVWAEGPDAFVVNAQGQLLVSLGLAGGDVTEVDDRGFWLRENGVLRSVWREGARVPQFGAEVTWLGQLSVYPTAILCSSGQVVLSTSVAGVRPASQDPFGAGVQGVWVVDRMGRTHLLCMFGTDIDVGSGGAQPDSREIERVHAIYRTDHREVFALDQTPADSSIRIPLYVEFTDGSEAIVVADFPEPCPSDWDASGETNSSDFLAYLNDWLAQQPAADLAPSGGDGAFDSSDFLAFLAIYSAGC
ncbi:MAG: GC-type dockerin domain-anchored protein [Phycisphaerales bacterium]|jgi:hypothetical protein|nr:GC-type dockerin domain-anchored protein [Phycisphaerales bacterium]